MSKKDVLEKRILTTPGSSIIPGSKFGAPIRKQNRWIVLGYGDTKCGKSSFFLNAPDPIVVFDLDRRLEGVVDPFLDAGKIIEVLTLDLPRVKPLGKKGKIDENEDAKVAAEARPVWDLIMEQYQLALEASLEGKVKTIIFDTHTEMVGLRLLKEFGRSSKIDPKDRGGLNADFAEIIRRSRNYPANVAHICHEKEEWKNNSPTGKMMPDGWNKLARAVDTVLRFDLDRDNDVNITVERHGFGLVRNGEVFTEDGDWGDTPSFPYLAADLVGGEVEDWMTDPRERKRLLR